MRTKTKVIETTGVRPSALQSLAALGTYSVRRRQLAISPITPRRNANTHTMNMTPNDRHPPPRLGQIISIAVTTSAPIAGPNTVPKPPSSVVNTTYLGGGIMHIGQRRDAEHQRLRAAGQSAQSAGQHEGDQPRMSVR